MVQPKSYVKPSQLNKLNTVCLVSPEESHCGFVPNIIDLFEVSYYSIMTVYIHNWPLQHASQDYGLASHTTHVVCVNFIRDWRDLEFNADYKRQIFGKLFNGRFIYSRSRCSLIGGVLAY